MRFWTVILTFIGLMAPGAVLAESEYSERPYREILLEFVLPEDQAALETLEADTRAALADRATDSAADKATADTISAMLDLLDAERLPFIRTDLPGDWRFRSYQMDALGAYTYSYFSGRLYPEGLAMVLDKSGGSQRHFGMMAGEAGDLAELDEMIYVGAESYETDPRPRLYSEMEAMPDADARERDEVGQLFRIGEDRFILVLAPEGGRYEIIEMVRS